MTGVQTCALPIFVKGADGNLLNKLIKVVPQVNQTLGIPRDEFLKLGAVGRENPSCP